MTRLGREGHIAETLAAGLAHGRQLSFGTDRNVGSVIQRIADDLGIVVHIVS